jgi:NAD(P)-dependent dehydrogenase (short-subunit alcohol dehydrogenase family)
LNQFMPQETPNLPGIAVVFGSSGGIGSALVAALSQNPRYVEVLGFSRSGPLTFDLADEASIATAAARITESDQPLRTVIDATGALAAEGCIAEKSWRQLDPETMARAFQINAIGPALLMKHFLPLLPREGRSVFATLSAKVGSIGDNQLGGWYSYRASKAALNQLVRTAAIELRRRQPQALCAALHPGTVATNLSAPFAKTGLQVQTRDHAAARLLGVIEGLQAADSGGFFNHDGSVLPW